jgi:KDO2-lipid IV(A) lauroyltransferase
LRTGAAIITGFALRTGPGFRHAARFDPPVDTTSTGDREADVLRIMTEINGRLAAASRRAPEQWLWAHRRWKSSPPAPAAEAATA